MRLLLPLLQVLLAAALTIHNRLRPIGSLGSRDRAPDRQLCDALNAPAAVMRLVLLGTADRWTLRYPLLQFIIETVIYMVLVWLLWYMVSIEIGGKGQSILTPRTRIRRIADVFLILFGILVATLGFLLAPDFLRTAYSNLVTIPHYIWGLAIIAFYGHDLLASFETNRYRAK